jgi:CarD family transcriptional regulator
MQFQVGDRVVHPIHGVGKVKSITQLGFVGDRVLPYYEVVTGAATVWVPVESEGLPRLRAIVSKASLAECRRLLTSDPTPLARSHKIRQVEISTRLKDGSLPSRCAVVRDLRAHSWTKPLGEVEDALLRRIANAVRDEWAASEGVAANKAMLEIEALLDKSRLAWMPDKGD